MTPPRSVALLAETRAVAAALADEVERDIRSRTVDLLLKRLRALAAATVAAAREERESFRNRPKQKSRSRGVRGLSAEFSASSKSTGRAPGRRRPRRHPHR
jgi:hypothetical protein